MLAHGAGAFCVDRCLSAGEVFRLQGQIDEVHLSDAVLGLDAFNTF
jgi:hypothetical protein